MAKQNTYTFDLQDNVSPGLKLMQQEAVKTATALKQIGSALSNLSEAGNAISNFVKQQQSLGSILKTNTQLLSAENKEFANASNAETAINGLVKAEQGLATVIKANSQALSAQNTEMGKFDKSLQSVGNSADKTGSDQMKKVTKGQDDMHKGFGKIADVITTKFNTALTTANDLNGKANTLYGSSTTLIGDLSGGVNSFSDVVNIAKDATAVWSDVQVLFNAVMEANPLGIVIFAIQEVIKVVSYAWNNFAGFREIVMGLWEVIKPFGKVIFEVLVLPFKLVGDALESVFYAVKAVWDGLTGHFSQAGDDLKKSIYYGFEAPVKDMKETVTGAIKDTSDAINAAPKNFKKGVKEGDASYAADHPNSTAGLANLQNKMVPGSNPSLDKAPKVDFGNTPSVKTTPSFSTEPKSIKVTNNIQNLIKDFSINTNNLKEGVASAKEMVAKALIDAVNDFNVKSGATT